MTAVDATAPPVAPGLVQAAAAGDRAAFETIYRRRVDAVGRYVRSIVGDLAATEDAVAQTFLEAWRDLPRLRRPERFDGWLFRIAHHRGIDAVRRLRRERPMELPDPPDEAAGPEDRAESREEAQRLGEALRALTGRQREVLIHRFLLGHSHEETAERTGLTVEASRQAQRRGLEALRRKIA
jgi:RNA polymerase sigma-70 factor (ECF subfamily)